MTGCVAVEPCFSVCRWAVAAGGVSRSSAGCGSAPDALDRGGVARDGAESGAGGKAGGADFSLLFAATGTVVAAGRPVFGVSLLEAGAAGAVGAFVIAAGVAAGVTVGAAMTRGWSGVVRLETAVAAGWSLASPNSVPGLTRFRRGDTTVVSGVAAGAGVGPCAGRVGLLASYAAGGSTERGAGLCEGALREVLGRDVRLASEGGGAVGASATAPAAAGEAVPGVDEAANGLFGVPSGAGTGPVFTGTAAGALALVLAGAVKTAAIWE
jgi:hypothetical protein